MQEFDRLVEIVKRLRAPDGCPWDKKQTLYSLKDAIMEEAAELVDALDNKDIENIKEELGDVLLHVVFHSETASESGLFNIEDVAKGINEKLIRRHPHVFKDEHYETAEEAINDLIKQFSESKIPEMKSFAGTLKNWRTEIINSFYVVYTEYVIDKEDGHVDLREKHITNAIIENRNKVVKLIKNNANGYHNWERFRNRMMYVMTPDATFTLTPKEKK